MDSIYLKKVLINFNDMLTDREYTINHVSPDGQTIMAATKTGDLVACFIIDNEKLTTRIMKPLLKECADKSIEHIIIVYTQATVKRRKFDVRVDLFPFSFFSINPTKHVLVPKHTRASNEEIASLSKITTFDKLPYLLKSDVICQYYDFDEGDIIRIDRKSGSVAYRKVL